MGFVDVFANEFVVNSIVELAVVVVFILPVDLPNPVVEPQDFSLFSQAVPNKRAESFEGPES